MLACAQLFPNSFIVQEESKSRTLLLVSGFIHDASFFLDSHPGGPALLTRNSGKDMTASFFGGVYAHSHAAHNVRTTALSAYDDAND
jgi:cytochrome b involved in lipid metabolism